MVSAAKETGKSLRCRPPQQATPAQGMVREGFPEEVIVYPDQSGKKRSISGTLEECSRQKEQSMCKGLQLGTSLNN